MYYGESMWSFIPKKLREVLLHELHLNHLGVTKIMPVTRSYMWWSSLDKDLENLDKACLACQSVKRAQPLAPLHPWVWPSKPWQ